MTKTMTNRLFGALVLLLGVLAPFATTPSAHADANDVYVDGGFSIELPLATRSFGYAFDQFPADHPGDIDGFALAGRVLVLYDSVLAIAEAPQSTRFRVVAMLPRTVDPSFLRISRTGTRIAVGSGYGQPLYIVDTSSLSVVAPLALDTALGVARYDLNFYDAAWRDDRYLAINAGWYSGSEIYVVDTLADPASPSAPRPLVMDIPGASGGLAFDAQGNLVTGVGYGDDTGEIRLFPAAAIEFALDAGVGLEYAEGNVLAEAALSAAFLSFDAHGNLFVGGGDYFGTTGNIGYYVVVASDVVERVGEGGAPADMDDPDEFSRVIPPGCDNPDEPVYSVSVYYAPATQMVVASCVFGGGGTTQVVFDVNAPDRDGDGVPDGADNAPGIYNPNQEPVANYDLDGDGLFGRAELDAFVNAFGSVTGGANYFALYDFDRNGTIDVADATRARSLWGRGAPF